jgi:hypothetical protein
MHRVLNKFKSMCSLIMARKETPSTKTHQLAEPTIIKRRITNLELGISCTVETRYLEHMHMIRKFRSRLRRQREKDVTLGRSSASLLCPGRPARIYNTMNSHIAAAKKHCHHGKTTKNISVAKEPLVYLIGVYV